MLFINQLENTCFLSDEVRKEKRARDKAKDEKEKQQQAIEAGEQTDWQQAMKEWAEWKKGKDGEK